MKSIIGPNSVDSTPLALSASAIAMPRSGMQREASLGTTTNLSANRVTRGLQTNLAPLIDTETGEIVPIESNDNGDISVAFNSAVFRHKKYALQATAAEILPYSYKFAKYSPKIKKDKQVNFRVAGCLRTVIAPDDNIKVYKSKEHGKCHYGGLMICGSVWTCPICASKITEKKSQIITATLQAHMDQKDFKGDAMLITLTFPHSRDDKLSDILTKFKAAEAGFSKTRAVMELKKELGFIEPIKSLEITYGHKNGFHPHSHQIWFTNNKMDHSRIKARLFIHWKNYCVKRGLESPSLEYGIDVRGGMKAGDYVSKMGWNLGSEVAKGHTKKSKGDRFAPFDLLQEYLNNETTWSKEKFREYAKATYSLHYISRFPKLQKLYDIVDKTDQELSEEKTDNADFVGMLDFKQWKKVLSYDYRALVLQLSEERDWGVVLKIVNGLPDPKGKKKRRRKNKSD